MKKLITLLCFIFAGCGGELPTYNPRTTPVHFGFYCSNFVQVSETKDFTDFHWECFFNGEEEGFKSIAAAQKDTFLDVTYQVYYPLQTGKFVFNLSAEENLRALKYRLQFADIYKHIKYIVPIDEPDINVLNVEDIHTVNLLVKKVFPELGLAINYAGISRLYYSQDADLVGFDQYGDDLFYARYFETSIYDTFIKRLSPTQDVMLFSGGGDPWQESPIPFFQKAKQDGRIKYIVAFLWIQRKDKDETILGIRDNGMDSIYINAYKEMK